MKKKMNNQQKTGGRSGLGSRTNTIVPRKPNNKDLEQGGKPDLPTMINEEKKKQIDQPLGA